jgi:hypothetical protein
MLSMALHAYVIIARVTRLVAALFAVFASALPTAQTAARRPIAVEELDRFRDVRIRRSPPTDDGSPIR